MAYPYIRTVVKDIFFVFLAFPNKSFVVLTLSVTKCISMDPKLKSAFDQFEASRLDLVAYVGTFPEEKLHIKKSENVWSPIQIMNHVSGAEESAVKYMNKKLKHTNAWSKSGWKASMRYALLKLSFYLPFKYKAPSVLKAPDNNLSLQETMEHWEKIRADMSLLLESLSEEQTKAELFKHPIVGRMNIYQALSFMHAHLDRHKAQVKRRITAM